MSADKNLYRVWPDGMERFEATALVRQDVLKREETARKRPVDCRVRAVAFLGERKWKMKL